MSYDGEFLDNKAVDDIAQNISQNVPASQCHAEKTLGVMTYIAFSSGRSRHTTIEGKTLFALNHTYEWYHKLKGKDAVMHKRIMTNVDEQSRTQLVAINAKKNEQIKKAILNEEMKKIAAAKQKLAEDDRRKVRVHSVAVTEPNALLRSVYGQSGTQITQKLKEQLRRYEQMKKDGTLQFAGKITYSNKNRFQLTDLMRRCYAAYSQQSAAAQ